VENRGRFVERSYDAIIVYWKIIILLKLLEKNVRREESVEVCGVEIHIPRGEELDIHPKA